MQFGTTLVRILRNFEQICDSDIFGKLRQLGTKTVWDENNLHNYDIFGDRRPFAQL